MLTFAGHLEQHFGLLYVSHWGKHWPAAADSIHSLGHVEQHDVSSFHSWHSGKHCPLAAAALHVSGQLLQHVVSPEQSASIFVLYFENKQ